MENKNVGFMIVGIASIMFLIVIIFSSTLKEASQKDCILIHGTDTCPMYDTITKQTYMAVFLVIIMGIIGLALIFSKPSERIVIKRIKEKQIKRKFNDLNLKPEEKIILKLIQKDGTIFQAEIIEKTGFGKAKVSRILDKLEGKDFIERKRRGMTNVVVLKN